MREHDLFSALVAHLGVTFTEERRRARAPPPAAETAETAEVALAALRAQYWQSRAANDAAQAQGRARQRHGPDNGRL